MLQCRETVDDLIDELGEETAAARPKRPGLPIEPLRLLRIVLEHRIVLLKAFGAALVVALAGILLLPRSYESYAQLYYEGTPLLDIDRESTGPAAFLRPALSPDRLRIVRERLDWSDSLGDLRDRLDVELEDGSSLRIAARADDAEEARLLAQTVLDVFSENQASYNAERLKALRSQTRVALESAARRREEATRAVDAFQASSGKSDLIGHQAFLVQRVATLRASADEAAVDLA